MRTFFFCQYRSIHLLQMFNRLQILYTVTYCTDRSRVLFAFWTSYTPRCTCTSNCIWAHKQMCGLRFADFQDSRKRSTCRMVIPNFTPKLDNWCGNWQIQISSLRRISRNSNHWRNFFVNIVSTKIYPNRIKNTWAKYHFMPLSEIWFFTEPIFAKFVLAERRCMTVFSDDFYPIGAKW